MKKIILLSLGLIAAVVLPAQSSAVIQSLQKGDIDKLSTYLDTEIELCFFNDEDIFSKKDAIAKLKNFFSNNPPISFTSKHAGGQEGSKYIVGLLKTKTRNFRVFIYLENENKPVIKEMRFEKPRM